MNIQSFLTSHIAKRYKRWNRKLSLSKREQLIIITISLTCGLVLTQLVPTDYRYQMVAFLSIVTYFFTAFGLRDDLGGVEWFTLLILPTLFTAAVAVFYFLLPVRWLTRIPIAFLYMIGMYALLLTENIYNVAANRTIALLRAAHSVGFILTVVTFYFLTQTILAQRSYGFVNVLGVGVVGYVLYIQFFWSINLDQYITPTIKQLSIGLSIALAEIAWIFSFWPVNQTLVSLLLTVSFYSTAGLGQQYLQQRLYKKTVIEFFVVVAIVFCIVLFGTHWRGSPGR